MKREPESDQALTTAAELDRWERELSASERGLDTQWAVHEHRLSVLSELRQLVTEREDALRDRARRLGVPEHVFGDALESDTGTDADLGAQDLALSSERAVILDQRRQICESRQNALDNCHALLGQDHFRLQSLEEQLIAREHGLTEAFRRLVGAAGMAGTTVEALPIVEEADASDGDLVGVPIAEVVTSAMAAEPLVPALRRRFRRIQVGVRVDFGTAHNFYSAETANVGVGGLFVATDNVLTLGRQVDLTVRLPDDKVVEVVGRVAWCRETDGTEGPRGFGIEFLDLAPDASAAIAAFLAERTPLAAEPALTV